MQARCCSTAPIDLRRFGSSPTWQRYAFLFLARLKSLQSRFILTGDDDPPRPSQMRLGSAPDSNANVSNRVESCRAWFRWIAQMMHGWMHGWGGVLFALLSRLCPPLRWSWLGLVVSPGLGWRRYRVGPLLTTIQHLPLLAHTFRLLDDIGRFNPLPQSLPSLLFRSSSGGLRQLAPPLPPSR